MPKAYVIGYKSRTLPDDAGNVDVDFSARLEDAYAWEKERAESECRILDHFRVEMATKKGMKHTCEGFKVVERTPGSFVVFCEIPFKPDDW
jgi:hypothetical protein